MPEDDRSDGEFLSDLEMDAELSPYQIDDLFDEEPYDDEDEDDTFDSGGFGTPIR